MTEKPHRKSQRETVQRVRDAETFSIHLPRVGRVQIPRPEVLAERFTYYFGLPGFLLLVGQLLSVFIVIPGMSNATPVMQYSSAIHHLVIAAIATVCTVDGFRLLVKRTTRDARKLPIVWAVVVAAIGISAASNAIYFAVESMVLLAHKGHIIALDPAQSKLAIKDLYGKSVYEILNAIPILKIPATIGWRDPIPRPALLGGIVLLLLKLLLLVGFARLFSQLWVAARTMRRNMRLRIRSEESAGDDEPAPASQDSDLLSCAGDSAETSPDTGEPPPD